MDAIILLATNVNSVNTRWMASLTFVAGLGGLSIVIKDIAIPELLKYDIYNSHLINILNTAHYACSFITQNFVPYTFLMFAIYYSNFFMKSRRILKYIFLIPIGYMLHISTVGTPFKIIIIWVIPYILIGSALFILSYIKEKNPILKRERALACIIAVIPMIFVLFANYIASATDHRNLFRFNTFIILLAFISFIVFILNYGIMGIKIYIERNRDYDDTIKAINSGA